MCAGQQQDNNDIKHTQDNAMETEMCIRAWIMGRKEYPPTCNVVSSGEGSGPGHGASVDFSVIV